METEIVLVEVQEETPSTVWSGQTSVGWGQTGDLVVACTSLVLERVEDEVQEDVELLLKKVASEAASTRLLGSTRLVLESCWSLLLSMSAVASKEVVHLDEDSKQCGKDSGRCFAWHLGRRFLPPLWVMVHS